MAPIELANAIQIRSAGRRSAPDKCGDPTNLPPVSRKKALYLVFCEGGSAEYFGGPQDRTAGVVGPGRGLVAWGGADLRFRLAGSDPYEMLGVTLVAADEVEARRIGAMLVGGVERLIGSGLQPPAPFIGGQAAETMRRYIEAMADEYRQQRIGWRVAMRAHLDLLLTELLRASALQEPQLSPGLAVSPSLEKAQTYFLTHFHDADLTLNDVARATGLSAKRLIALFSEAGMPSPMAHLRRMRLEHARRLVRRGELRIKEVAGSVGIPAPHHSSRLYRQHFGVSPTEERRACASAASG